MLWHQLVALAILGLALTQLQFTHSADVTVSTCAKNFTLVGDKCLLAGNQWYSWYEADRYCHTLGAGLVSLQNQTQLQLLNNWLKNTTSFTLEYWSSGNSFGQKGIYYWQNTGEQARYLPWATGQPQTALGDCLSLYASVYNVSDYKLSIKNCTSWSSPICEQKPQKVSSRICLKTTAYETAQVLVN